MTGGLIDFFVLEASEYVEQLDGLASRASAQPPDAVPFARAARALRGSATMAKLLGIASVAQGLERLAKALREEPVRWTPATRSAAIAAIDDLKILVRGARVWGDEEDARVARRVAELEGLAPREIKTITRGKGAEFLSTAAAEAATGLLAYAEHPGSPAEFAETMRRVRALRGVAALRDLPPLLEVVDALDAAAKPVELRQEDATAERRRLFRTAARVLLEGGEAVRRGGLPPTESAAVREFAHAVETMRAGNRESEVVVPIDSLFPDGPGGVNVDPGPNPPTTAAERFRLEVVSQAEHLRRLVADGRGAVDAATRDRVGRELRSAVRALSVAAQSFSATEVSNLFLATERGAASLENRALWVLDEAGAELSRPSADAESVAPRFLALHQRLAGTPPAPTAVAPARQRRAGFTPSASAPALDYAWPTDTATAEPSTWATPAPTIPAPPTPATAAPRERALTPRPTSMPPSMPPSMPTVTPSAGGASGAALRDLLASGIAGLAPLATDHIASRAVGEDDDVVPIEELLFRGRDALQRAIGLGDEMRRTAAPPDPAVLSELYDLLQLAAAD